MGLWLGIFLSEDVTELEVMKKETAEKAFKETNYEKFVEQLDKYAAIAAEIGKLEAK